MKDLILALDAGTTSSRAIVFSKDGRPLSIAAHEFPQLFPHDGWVEHNPDEIFASQLGAIRDALTKGGFTAKDITAIGITNQRETAVVWDRRTGSPLCNAIVWQCRRTADVCEELRAAGYTEMIRKKTGLVLDPYFSATKLSWMLDNVPGLRKRAEAGEACFGTVDTYLMWKLSGGTIHATDYSNASRTMLFNINTLEWDEELLSLFRVPRAMLPGVYPSSHLFGYSDEAIVGSKIPICGVAGDQQSALFGQRCFNAGDLKNTYGTGAFLLMNTGHTPCFTDSGLITTVAWGIDGKVSYALEGSVFVCGAAIQWLRDGLGIISTAAESEAIATSVSDSGGVYLVPAFVGLGAPYWDAYARGTIYGITRATTRAHIVRAAIESMAYQTCELIELMERGAKIKISELRVDGGASANSLLMNFQSDLLGAKVKRPACVETTALGAAYLAALGAGIYNSIDEIAAIDRGDTIFTPKASVEWRRNALKEWRNAVSRSLGQQGKL